MTLALRHPETWQQNIILREWEPVPIDLVHLAHDPTAVANWHCPQEFRTFVTNGRMTAISQYAYQLYSPRLNDSAQLHSASTAIRDAFESLWPIVSANGFTDCVLDFGVIPPAADDGSWRCTLIEVNPFEETTDGALFSWTRERDVIEGRADGLEYPVVRILEARRHGALAMTPRVWKDVILKVERKFSVDGSTVA